VLGTGPAGFSYSLVHNTMNKSIDLFVSPLGDFNRDGAVDAGDYVVWRKNPGDIYGPDDYTNWRAHFGQSADSGSWADVNTAVPEPASALLLLVGLLAMRSQRRACVINSSTRETGQQPTDFEALRGGCHKLIGLPAQPGRFRNS
jgi:hypothetical protein